MFFCRSRSCGRDACPKTTWRASNWHWCIWLTDWRRPTRASHSRPAWPWPVKNTTAPWKLRPRRLRPVETRPKCSTGCSSTSWVDTLVLWLSTSSWLMIRRYSRPESWAKPQLTLLFNQVNIRIHNEFRFERHSMKNEYLSYRKIDY